MLDRITPLEGYPEIYENSSSERGEAIAEGKKVGVWGQANLVKPWDWRQSR